MKKLTVLSLMLMVISIVTIANAQTIEVRVSASSDDAEESSLDGTVDLTSTDLELVNEVNQGDQTVGMRFNGMQIPRGAVILDAYIQFQVDEPSSEAIYLLIHGEDVDYAQPFSDSTQNISSRTRTSASREWCTSVQWPTVGEAGSDQRTPNIWSIIKEIVDRPGWSNGNSLAIIITGSGQRVAESYDGDQAGAPLLHVEYMNMIPVANSQILEVQVSASSDDAEESSSGDSVRLTSTDLELVYDAVQDHGNQTVGMRFNGVQIPRTQPES